MFEKAKTLAASVKAKVNTKMLAFPAVGTAAALGTSAVAFASETGGASSLPSVAITEDMLSPLVEGVVANIGVILPIGLGLFGIMIGVRIIPSLINRFLRG